MISLGSWASGCEFPPALPLTFAPFCGRAVSVGGNLSHGKKDTSVAMQGAADDAGGVGRMNGTKFTVSITLPASSYTIEIGEVETVADAPGERQFDVMFSDAVLAAHFDIFTTAGRARRKVCYITGEVEHGR